MINAANRTKRENFFLILLIGALNAITPFSIDMYLPAFPKIAADLHTTISNIALSVSTYFLGFSLGQILYGPLLDRFGRKRPLYFGLVIYIIATLGCAASSSLEQLLIIRFIQALGGCVASVAAMAMVRDFFHADESARVISFLILILGASPLLAPTIGGFIVSAFGWHFVFVLLAAMVFIMLLLTIFFLPEGHQPDIHISLKPTPIINGFKNVLTEPKFYVFALAGTFSFSGLFVYVAGSPGIFMDGFHMSAKLYGGVFALLSVGFIGGSQLNHILTRKFSNEKIFTTTLISQVVLSVFFLTGVINSWYGLYAIIIFLFFLLLCSGLTYPNAAAIALSPFTKNAGTASALLGFIQIGVGGLISSGIGLLPFTGSLATAFIMAITSFVALIILVSGRPKLVKSVSVSN